MLIVLDDPRLQGHLVEALARHCLRLRRDGHVVPRELTALMDALTPGSSGQERSGGDLPRGRLLTYTQAARMLGCSESTVRRRVRDGTYSAVRCGHLVRLVADELLTITTTEDTTR